ncbi:MAG: TatD family hydrolase [Candidatus Moranbacteria bacterium]|nr:TatD family hydrolase [Candidatus Moranbacteria bacterium]
MIDSHAHLDDRQYDQDREATIARAFASGVEKIINIGADLAGSIASVELAIQYDNVFATVGLHPNVFDEFDESQVQELCNEIRNLASNEKVVAIGEIGLDYYSHDENSITPEQKENQKKSFVAQIEIAREFNLPVVIHCRDAYEDVYEIIEKYPEVSFVFHCYGGGLEFTQKLLSMNNVWFSFTGNITYAKSDLEVFGVVKEIPLERIMLETDCPYLTPVPHRGKRNEPAYVTYVQGKIAEIKQISANKVDEVTTRTAKKFLSLA